MSRSHRKPYVKCGFSGSKRLASKTVRRTKMKYNNGLYKKLYDSYNIVDYKAYSDDIKDRRK